MSSLINHILYGAFAGVVAGGFMSLGNRLTITIKNNSVSPFVSGKLFIGMGILSGATMGLTIGLFHKLFMEHYSNMI